MWLWWGSVLDRDPQAGGAGVECASKGRGPEKKLDMSRVSLREHGSHRWLESRGTTSPPLYLALSWVLEVHIQCLTCSFWQFCDLSLVSKHILKGAEAQREKGLA